MTASPAPGPAWDALPVPALLLDGSDAIAALNDAAEIWLNLSRRSALGKPLEGDEMAARLRIAPPLGPLLARVRAAGDGFYLPRVAFEVGDRAGGHSARRATVHAAPYGPAGGAALLIVPDEPGGTRAPSCAARSAIGMAEMLAHEIKNPLAGIRGAAQLIAMNAGPDDRAMAEMIVSESRRIVALLDQVERFGDTSDPDFGPVNIHDVLERVRRSAGAGFAAGLTLATDYDPSLPLARADADQLTQVCLNLVKNAAEAIADQPDRRTQGTIRLRSFYDRAMRPLPLQIEIEDDGPGLPPAIADQVFEPFVSGRENGTGLGLALVSKIVTDHGAELRVESRPGRTVFRLSLARAQD